MAQVIVDEWHLFEIFFLARVKFRGIQKISLYLTFAEFMLSTATRSTLRQIGLKFLQGRYGKNCHSFPNFMKIDERAFVMYTEI